MSKNNPNPQCANLVLELQDLDSSALADVMVRMGLEQQVLSPAFKSLNPRSKMIGPAICAQAREQSQHKTVNPIELDDQVYPLGIVVIAAEACSKGALLGDNMISSMVANGAKGFVVDGGIRDAAELQDAKHAVLYRYTSSVNAWRYYGLTEFEIPVTLEGIWGSVQVNPGDFIFADYDGAVVIPLQHIESIIHDTEIHVKNEAAIKSALLFGSSRREALEKFPRLQHVKPLII
jgi:4-hydroxy-4-methyl-2-oxoglutarate aldolase